jgi:hypothetical protein
LILNPNGLTKISLFFFFFRKKSKKKKKRRKLGLRCWSESNGICKMLMPEYLKIVLIFFFFKKKTDILKNFTVFNNKS